MPPVDVDQSLASDQAEPDEDRTGRIDQKMINPLHSRQPGFLQHVVRVDSSVQPGVHAKRDHPPEPVTMLRKQFGQRVLIPFGDLAEQFVVG